MRYFFFNDLFLLATPLPGNGEERQKYYKHFILTKETMLIDDQVPMTASILFGKEKISVKFYENQDCIVFKNRLREVCANLSFNQDSSTKEDILKKPKFSGTLFYKRSIQKKNVESNFVEIFLRLKGDTIFFYLNEDSSLPKFIVGLRGITICFAEEKVKKENVIELTNEKNGHIMYLHTPKQDLLFQWLKFFSFTSAKIDKSVRQNYMKEITNHIHFKVSCE